MCQFLSLVAQIYISYPFCPWHNKSSEILGAAIIWPCFVWDSAAAESAEAVSMCISAGISCEEGKVSNRLNRVIVWQDLNQYSRVNSDKCFINLTVSPKRKQHMHQRPVCVGLPNSVWMQTRWRKKSTILWICIPVGFQINIVTNWEALKGFNHPICFALDRRNIFFYESHW